MHHRTKSEKKTWVIQLGEMDGGFVIRETGGGAKGNEESWKGRKARWIMSSLYGGYTHKTVHAEFKLLNY